MKNIVILYLRFFKKKYYKFKYIIIILYLRLNYKFKGIVFVRDYLWKCPSISLINKVLFEFGAKIGEKDVRIGPYIYIHNAEVKNDFSNLKVGNDVYIGPHVVLDLWGKIIFKGCNGVGMHSKIFTHSNFVGAYSVMFPTTVKDVVFEEHAGVNPGVIVLAGVTIGRNSYVTPGSVVSKTIPEYVIATGNAAKPVHQLPKNVMENYQKRYIEDRKYKMEETCKKKN